ncbi:MAG: hypothetical protein SFU86_24950 [Pirellulaceae bacterium]|nr:hypothetical protein [Pirellulaceae bacterium]
MARRFNRSLVEGYSMHAVSRWFRLLALILAISVPAVIVLAQTKGTKVVKRAQPPKFGPDTTFYADAFKDGLVGDRPANLGQAVASVGGNTPGPSSSGTAPAGVAGSGWSAIISAATIEDSIKSLKLQVDAEVTTPSDFAGKGAKLARRDFSVLAMLFAIAGEYDGDVRWKKDAPAARDVFARTAANAKVGTPQVFQEAKLRKEELTDLVGGAGPFAGKEAETKASWKDVCNRSPLMQYLELIWEPKLKPLLADKGQFTASADKVLADAEMIAAIGDVLGKEGMEDADSEEYKKFCDDLRKGGRDIVDGVKLKNFEQATAGGTTISKACAECHENYRS